MTLRSSSSLLLCFSTRPGSGFCDLVFPFCCRTALQISGESDLVLPKPLCPGPSPGSSHSSSSTPTVSSRHRPPSLLTTHGHRRVPSLFCKLPCGLETGFGWAKPVRYPTVIPWKEGHFEGTQVTLLKVERCPIGSLWSGRSSWWLTWHYCAHHLQTRCPPFPPDLNRLKFFFLFCHDLWHVGDLFSARD